MQQAEVTSITLGARERRILADHQRRGLDVAEAPNRSHLIRLLIRQSAEPTQKAAVVQLQRHEAEKQELVRRLEVAEQLAQREAERAEQASQKAEQATGYMQRLLRHLPWIRDRVTDGLEVSSGDRTLDLLWHNKGRRWSIVLAHLEAYAARTKPPDGPPAAT